MPVLPTPPFRRWRKGAKGEDARLFLSIQNLLDEDYEEEYGYPMPGITFMAGFRASF